MSNVQSDMLSVWDFEMWLVILLNNTIKFSFARALFIWKMDGHSNNFSSRITTHIIQQQKNQIIQNRNFFRLNSAPPKETQVKHRVFAPAAPNSLPPHGQWRTWKTWVYQKVPPRPTTRGGVCVWSAGGGKMIRS